jgi:SAM-dependent methyltransferase
MSADWRLRDQAREGSRQIYLARMIDAVPFAREAALRVVDIGGGFGAASKAVLQAFPRARVTLHDYSQVMFDQARDYLADYADRVRMARGDLWDRSWTAQLGGPFDLAVSALCIHNLHGHAGDRRLLWRVRTVLKPGGVFLDYDHFEHIEDMAAHLGLFEQAGTPGSNLWHEPRPRSCARWPEEGPEFRPGTRGGLTGLRPGRPSR